MGRCGGPAGELKGTNSGSTQDDERLSSGLLAKGDSFPMARQICYCFNHTEQDIIDDVRRHGNSRILAEIKMARAMGRCQCLEKHPRGT